MKALRLYLIFIVFFVSHLLASAQSSFRLINTSAGLPDDEVKALFWTSDGRLGVRTSSSLSFLMGAPSIRFLRWVMRLMLPIMYRRFPRRM